MTNVIKKGVCYFNWVWHAGAEDPWEKVEWGRKLQHYPTVEEFVAFPGKLACPSIYAGLQTMSSV